MLGVRLRATAAGQVASTVGPYAAGVLPAGIRSRFVDNGNGMTTHVLEAGFEPRNRPLVVLLHGFPELAYSWRKVMPVLASAGYHVIAPDLRGYGRSSGTDVKYDDEIAPFRTMNYVRDILGLVSAFGARSVAAVVGHDFGSPLAGWCALARPDVFRSVVMMSGPFPGPPALPFGTADAAPSKAAGDSREGAYDDLEKLSPPRQYYQRYYATREANADMQHAKQGVHAFLRAYYHMKSADWPGNHPAPLAGWSATELAKMPRYYVMDRNMGGMAENVAPEMPSAAEIVKCRWMTEAELTVYSMEYSRTGFQGGLDSSYRLGASGRYTDAQNANELKIFSGRTIDVPSMFIGGKSDWGPYQRPGALENMQKNLCTRMVGTHFIDGAGHWVQQEQPEAVTRLLVDFIQHAR